ncbi:MAG: hypothetical protein WBM96_21810 [Polyangiales bacterium]
MDGSPSRGVCETGLTSTAPSRTASRKIEDTIPMQLRTDFGEISPRATSVSLSSNTSSGLISPTGMEPIRGDTWRR